MFHLLTWQQFNRVFYNINFAFLEVGLHPNNSWSDDYDNDDDDNNNNNKYICGCGRKCKIVITLNCVAKYRKEKKGTVGIINSVFIRRCRHKNFLVSPFVLVALHDPGRILIKNLTTKHIWIQREYTGVLLAANVTLALLLVTEIWFLLNLFWYCLVKVIPSHWIMWTS